MADPGEAIRRAHPLNVEPHDTLRAAALLTASRLLPGSGVPEPRHLALLAETEAFDPPRRWTDDSARILSALLVARARRDALGDGIALIARYFDGTHLNRPAGLSPGARSELLSSVGEYLCAVGSPQSGVRFGEEAQLFADTDALRYRALAVSSFGLALNGENERAAPTVRAATDLFVEAGWDPREGSFLILLADCLVSAARMDHDRLSAISGELAALAPDDPYLDYASLATEVMCRLIRREFADGIAASWQLLHGSRRHSSQRVVRHLLMCIRSDLFLAHDQPADGLAVVATALSPEGHGTCFATQRAIALLLLGREREALLETDACAASEDDHCLRTLPRLMLLRAIAFRRIGQERRARQSMASALMLISRTGSSRTPFIMIPAVECADLVEAAAEDHPELAGTAASIRDALLQLAARPHAAPPARDVPGLTPTEHALAALLATGSSLAQIARERGVSVNTVKSQVRSIYVKLGVSTRAQAVAHLSADA